MPVIPAAVAKTFATRLTEATHIPVALPANLRLGTVFEAARQARTDDSIRAAVVSGKHVLYLDFLLHHRSGTDEYLLHGRIHADGRYEPLENLEAQLGLPVTGDDEADKRTHAAIGRKNARTRRLLREKGLIP